jgi:protein-S-isoprenylcysteine O-methyltransferase Ste14
MIEERIFTILLIVSFPLAAGVFVVLLYINAPYGRHQQRGWGPVLPNRVAWLVMESPSAILFVLLFFIGDAQKNLSLLIFLVMWEAHYIHRAFIYPFMITNGSKVMPIATMLMAIGFNAGNAYLNGRHVFSFSGGYPSSWLGSPQMIAGLILFISGFVLNRWADRVLQNLREPGKTAYKIPYGGFYRWISCPNYLGEILEWIGWAVATWSLPGLAFAVWTIANLAPRARANHICYHQNFSDYPPERKALIPGIW